MTDEITRWLGDDRPGRPVSVSRAHYTDQELRQFLDVCGDNETYTGAYHYGNDSIGHAHVIVTANVAALAHQLYHVDSALTAASDAFLEVFRVARRHSWTQVKQEMQDVRDYRADLNRWADDGGTVGLVDY